MLVYRAKDRIKDGLSLDIFFSSNFDNLEHRHDYIEIVYVKSGTVTEVVNGKSFEMGRGDLLFINYDSTHRFVGSDDLSFYNICFAPDVLANCVISNDNAFDLLTLSAFEELKSPTSEGVITFSGKERVWIESILDDMLAEYKAKSSDMRSVLESCMILLITKILRKMRLVLNTHVIEQDVFNDLTVFIGANLDKKLTLADLAKKCFYNPSYFSRVFKEKFGVTFQDYVNRSRVSMAAQLLRESRVAVSDVAERCGFGDKSTFYRAFSKAYGCTPAEYRRSENKK